MNSSSARIGHARVSTADQNLDAQIAALQAARCTMARTETGDGATLIVPGGQSISERCTTSSVPLTRRSGPSLLCPASFEILDQ